MTEVTYNGKEVDRMEIHDDGDYIWFVVRTKDGNTYSTYNLKGEV
jgi:hypothetical protein